MSMLTLKNVSYIYSPDTPFAKKALDNINLTLEEGEFIGLIGHTGSGKSTLVQLLNGLLKPTTGDIYVEGESLRETKSLKHIRQKIGLVFQYPEYQLFEETVEKDIAFGPINLGCNKEEIKRRVKESMEAVGLSYEDMKDRSPFELSGGQKRRVAIAGVLAMEPKVLVLDEPTAGLDPHGRDEILSEVKELFKKKGITIILVSHSMEDVADLADRMIVMYKGTIAMDGNPKDIFRQDEKLRTMGLGVPQINGFIKEFKKVCGKEIPTDAITVQEAKEVILKYLKERDHA
ncbi:MAG: energy-coupling factor transporter ATPase [Tissierellia bacterium]|nr:energy-coupling factor transporter ATPase [Tissierellia bacterium]